MDCSFIAAGFESVHWSSLGKRDARDTEIMAYAAANNYVVFRAILAANQGEKPSVVQIRADDVSPDVIGAKVVQALCQMADELRAGALLTVDTNRARLRLLPMRRG